MRIAIIGGGAIVALMALHLARALPPGSAEIMVIEPAEEVGRGLAYSTDDPEHLLNVRVANMGAFADQPDRAGRGNIRSPRHWPRYRRRLFPD